MNIFLYFLIFIFGASIASFLNVYIERGNVWGRSMCLNCLKKLNAFELFPVFSYIFLRGKCKKCKTKIPSKLFFTEIFLGVWFLATFLLFSNTTELILLWIFGSIFFILSLEDLENMEVSFLYLIILILLSFLNGILQFQLQEILFSLLVISPFWIIYLINRNWIGLADPLVYSAVALFFGLQFTISYFLYSIWIGTFFAVTYLIIKHKKLKSGVRIPFIPILFFSTLFLIIFDYHIIKINDILIINEIFFSQF